jgi:hypothetical protein
MSKYRADSNPGDCTRSVWQRTRPEWPGSGECMLSHTLLGQFSRPGTGADSPNLNRPIGYARRQKVEYNDGAEYIYQNTFLALAAQQSRI